MLLLLHAHLLEGLVEGCLEAVHVACSGFGVGVLTLVRGVLCNSLLHHGYDGLWYNASFGAFLELLANFTLRQCVFATLVDVRVDPFSFLVPMFAISASFLSLRLLGQPDSGS